MKCTRFPSDVFNSGLRHAGAACQFLYIIQTNNFNSVVIRGILFNFYVFLSFSKRKGNFRLFEALYMLIFNTLVSTTISR